MLLQRPRVPAPMRFAIMPGSSYWVSGPRRTSLATPRHRVPTRDLPRSRHSIGRTQSVGLTQANRQLSPSRAPSGAVNSLLRQQDRTVTARHQ